MSIMRLWTVVETHGLLFPLGCGTQERRIRKQTDETVNRQREKTHTSPSLNSRVGYEEALDTVLLPSVNGGLVPRNRLTVPRSKSILLSSTGVPARSIEPNATDQVPAWTLALPGTALCLAATTTPPAPRPCPPRRVPMRHCVSPSVAPTIVAPRAP